MSKKSHKSVHKSLKNTPFSWMELIYSSNVFAFAEAGGLDDTFTEVGSSSNRGSLSLFEQERICDKYGGGIIPFYGCVFSTLGLRLPFTIFEIEDLKHLSMAPSQLHPTCWAYIKVY